MGSRRREPPGSDGIRVRSSSYLETTLVSESAHFILESESNFEASNVEFGVEVS